MMDEARCPGRDGEPCRTPERLLLDPDGDGIRWCYAHSPDPRIVAQRTKAAARGGQATARRFGASRGLSKEDLGSLSTAADAQRVLALVAVSVADGRLSPTRGNAVAGAVRRWMEALDLRLRETQLTEALERLDRLERRNPRTRAVR